MARVVIDKLSKVFTGPRGHSVPAVQEASLTVEDTELVVLVGPSGCGKTTLLRMIAGLEEPTGGTVAIDGQVVNGVPPQDRDLAMVFQNRALYPHLTVRQNLAFGLQLRKVPRAEIERRVREAADLLELAACLDRLPRALSGGEQQRVALGRALVRRPKVFLLDEPLSHLDAPLRGQMRAEIGRLHRRLRATIIYVTHDQEEAMTLGTRLAVMNAGALQQVAEPLALYHAPANRFVAGFIGSPPMNFLPGRLIREGTSLWFQEEHAGPNPAERWPVPPDHGQAARLPEHGAEDCVLGLRPEAISVQTALRAPDCGVTGTVDAVEPRGAETLLYVSRDRQTLAVRVAGDCAVPVAQSVWLRFDMARARFFDRATGTALP